MRETGQFQTIPFPSAREIIMDAGFLASRRHIAHAFLEIDVTRARHFIHERKMRTGETLSFTAYAVKCLAAAIEAHPLVQAYRGWSRRLVLFADVDVATLIEIEQDKVAVPHIIRAANRKTVHAIHQEIRAVQSRTTRSPQAMSNAKWIRRIPRVVRLPMMRLAMKNPHVMKKYSGTVVVTSVGMFGRGYGWALGFLALHTLGIALGGIAQKPAICEGELTSRDYLCITISFDHDVVDGAPVARFAATFKELLESGFDLEELG